MEDFNNLTENRPESLQDGTESRSEPFGFGDDQCGLGLALGLVLFLLPVGMFVGVMRWRIAPTLDADLKWILTKFCDTVLLFCIALPICPLLPGEWGSKLSRRVFKGVSRLLMVAKWIGILAFATAAVYSIGYCCWMLWKLVAD